MGMTKTVLAGLTIAIAVIANANADDDITTICLSDEPLLVEDRDGQRAGLFVSMFAEAARRAGKPVEFHRRPWKRCQQEAASGKQIGLGPLTRNKRREEGFSWVAPIMPMRIVYLTVQGQQHPVADLDDARQRLVGIKRASAGVFAARKHKIPETNQVMVDSQEQLLKMLLRGRIDTWLTWDIVGHRTIKLNIRDEALAVRMLEEGYVENLGTLWFAASPGLSDHEIADWRMAFDSMARDGTVRDILIRHLGTSYTDTPKQGSLSEARGQIAATPGGSVPGTN